MKEIRLAGGKTTIVDDDDFDFINKWKWHLDIDGYAKRNTRAGNKSRTIKMHREIMNTPDGMETDHINGNKLDNRKCNLRIATSSQNHANSKVRNSNKTGKKGVRVDHGKYRAQISIHGKKIHLGMFDSLDDAATAYAEKAKEIYGEFASTGE